ncbi:hypothetical protein [Nostoc sp. FACHB-145]|uniref:hypothetical protein n=1 Tax=Nostoc sp. FACHB-145 TaxID=2692836 RepID=UPI001F54D73F|nr:hypothetical protein [Nostoc sp. FACHB-145]
MGSTGSGKSVFLASLFKELSTQGKYGFYLDVEEPEKRKRLNHIYSQIITGEVWPPGTRYSEVSEWTFTCCVKTGDLKDYPACQFTYYDYCGGRLTDSSEDPEFDGIVKEADTLLGLLDGQKIYGLMAGTNDFLVSTFVNKDLPNILRKMQSCRVPIHFVISKWDILEKEFSLQEIRKRLLKIPEFAEVIQSRVNTESPVRIIPVSSVGSRFAKLQPDGSMKKNPSAIPHPFLTEVPLACVFPDAFKARIYQLKQEQKLLTKKQENPFEMFFSVIDTIKPILGLGYGVLLNFLPPNYKVAKPLLEKLGEVLDEAVQKGQEAASKRSEKLFKEQINSLKQVKDEETALTHAVDSFLYIQSYLTRDFPESDLSLI